MTEAGFPLFYGSASHTEYPLTATWQAEHLPRQLRQSGVDAAVGFPPAQEVPVILHSRPLADVTVHSSSSVSVSPNTSSHSLKCGLLEVEAAARVSSVCEQQQSSGEDFLFSLMSRGRVNPRPDLSHLLFFRPEPSPNPRVLSGWSGPLRTLRLCLQDMVLSFIIS